MDEFESLKFESVIVTRVHSNSEQVVFLTFSYKFKNKNGICSDNLEVRGLIYFIKGG